MKYFPRVLPLFLLCGVSATWSSPIYLTYTGKVTRIIDDAGAVATSGIHLGDIVSYFFQLDDFIAPLHPWDYGVHYNAGGAPNPYELHADGTTDVKVSANVCWGVGCPMGVDISYAHSDFLGGSILLPKLSDPRGSEVTEYHDAERSTQWGWGASTNTSEIDGGSYRNKIILSNLYRGDGRFDEYGRFSPYGPQSCNTAMNEAGLVSSVCSEEIGLVFSGDRPELPESTVPEPGSLALMTLGLLGLMTLRNKASSRRRV